MSSLEKSLATSVRAMHQAMALVEGIGSLRSSKYRRGFPLVYLTLKLDLPKLDDIKGYN